MPTTVYFDLHRMLRRLDADDVARLEAEFGAGAAPEPERLEALRAMTPALLRRVLTRREQPIADRLVRVVGLAPSVQVVRPLLAVLVLAPDLEVRSETVEDVLVSLGSEAVGSVTEALVGLATFPRTPVRVVASLARVLARIGDPRGRETIVACLRVGVHGQWALLDALCSLSRSGDDREQALAFVARRASNRQHAIEKGLWPRYGRKGISPLRVRLLRARYARALRHWQDTDGVR